MRRRLCRESAGAMISPRTVANLELATLLAHHA
jgi:hypothetical protein